MSRRYCLCVISFILVISQLIASSAYSSSIGMIFVGASVKYTESLTRYLDAHAASGDRAEWRTQVIPYCDHQMILNTVESMIAGGVRAFLLIQDCGAPLLYLGNLLDQEGIQSVVWAGAGSALTPSPGRMLLFETPSLVPSVLIDRLAAKPSHLAGWCDDGIDSYDIDQFGPFVMCIERPRVNEATDSDALKGAAIASLQVLLSHPDLGGTAQIDGSSVSVGTELGPLEVNWRIGRVRIPAGVMLDRDHPDVGQSLGMAGPITSPEDLSRMFCPNCTATGDICGSSCPQECGSKTCTQKGDKQCCSSNGMPAPAYSSDP